MLFCKKIRAHQCAREDLKLEVYKVASAFTGALYYEKDGSVHKLSDGATVIAASGEALAHMRGERDPKSGHHFPPGFSAVLEGLRPALLTHDHRPSASEVQGTQAVGHGTHISKPGVRRTPLIARRLYMA